jgi:hypothetical protein
VAEASFCYETGMHRVEKFQSSGGGRKLRGTFDFAVIDDHARLPWRFLARRMAMDGLSRAS